MRVIEQTTLARPVAAGSIGLHTGQETKVILRPAKANQGVVFRRIDLLDKGLLGDEAKSYEKISINVDPRLVSDTRLGTTLTNKTGISIATVEHLMAALSICGVDNVLIDVMGPEIPIFDGSSARFVQLIHQAGVTPLDAVRYAMKVTQQQIIDDGDRFIAIEPAEAFILEIAIDFDDPAINRQAVCLRLDSSSEIERLVQARTFCLLKDVEPMRSAGYGRGGSLENSLVVDEGRLLNDTGLRDPLEFVLHKALDLIGDLYLIGAPLIGHVRAHKPGHDLNMRLATLLKSDQGFAEPIVAPAPEDDLRLFA